MSLPSYPNVPNKPDPTTWSMAPAVPPIQTPMNGGNQRRRSLPGSDVKVISQKVTMTKSDHDTFKSFYDSDLGYGASRFTMDVWLGNGYTTKTVQFMDDFPHVVWFSFTHVQLEMKLLVFGA